MQVMLFGNNCGFGKGGWEWLIVIVLVLCLCNHGDKCGCNKPCC